METTSFKKDASVIAAGFKAKGMTKQEITELLKHYPSKNSPKEDAQIFNEKLCETEENVAFRRDTKRATIGVLSALTSLSLLSISKAAHTCVSPKTMYTCIGLSILFGLYSYSRFNRIGEPLRNEEKRIQKAELKAAQKLANSKERDG